jgi:hypothetical protein
MEQKTKGEREEEQDKESEQTNVMYLSLDFCGFPYCTTVRLGTFQLWNTKISKLRAPEEMELKNSKLST